VPDHRYNSAFLKPGVVLHGTTSSSGEVSIFNRAGHTMRRLSSIGTPSAEARPSSPQSSRPRFLLILHRKTTKEWAWTSTKNGRSKRIVHSRWTQPWARAWATVCLHRHDMPAFECLLRLLRVVARQLILEPTSRCALAPHILFSLPLLAACLARSPTLLSFSFLRPLSMLRVFPPCTIMKEVRALIGAVRFTPTSLTLPLFVADVFFSNRHVYISSANHPKFSSRPLCLSRIKISFRSTPLHPGSSTGPTANFRSSYLLPPDCRSSESRGGF
jgi:hypothetical protein